MAQTLQRILEEKTRKVAAARGERDLGTVRAEAERMDSPRDFLGAIRGRLDAGRLAVIAEIKQASPSKGLLREDFDPRAIAESYAHAGATCLSVLTDAQFFGGRLAHLRDARAAFGQAALRTDLMVDSYTV